ncbi:carbohydrate-binding module family 48 protein [Xylona heveae TC161]|uniref:Carbohydrate-binding module family 48 protein n=1 Tax=Xylona heveae (strain CBS 132557 / TC161) TaxID=1328760 RepID=A0A164ZWC0_XYLHT|nr:carbohydrate-binding module family 48 protein [Xylona heveae TC161]KZF19616.1 carbohydrate-binding module family 48 protein [Xylona heveae TC161]
MATSTSRAPNLGSYTFKWSHPAQVVYVTGTFDNWSKSVKLEKNDAGVFEKTVNLPKGQKIYYKFVVDGVWTTDHTAPHETDPHSNLNSVLLPEQLDAPKKGAISSAAPGSTTAELAKGVPLEKPTPGAEIPGFFPETPVNEASDFSVKPIPATEGAGNPVKLAPGEKVPDPSTLTSNTVSSTAHDDPALKASAEGAQQTFGVAPLPATAGAGNPIHLQPGEKVPKPSEFTTSTVNSTVTTDKESYDKAGAAPPQLPMPVTPQAERERNGDGVFGAGMFGVPPVTNATIPESSLPMGSEAPEAEKDPGVTIQSAAPESTTAALAAAVPLEPKHTGPQLPEVVKESQEKADVTTEASGSPEAVANKAAVEEQLQSAIPAEPATTETAAPAATAVPQVVKESQEKAHAAPEASSSADVIAEKAQVEKELQKEVPVEPATTEGTAATTETSTAAKPPTAAVVPEVVKESRKEAHWAPEASGSPNAVAEKAIMEEELEKEVPEQPSTTEEASLPTAPEVPEIVAESQQKAHVAPEAAASAAAVADKTKMESELQSEVSKEPVTSGESILPSAQEATETVGLVAGAAVAGAATAGAAIAAAASSAKDKAVEVTNSVSNTDAAPTAAAPETPATQATTATVPEVVKESFAESHQSPEAAANREAVIEKKEMESELLHEIKPEEGAGQPAPTASAALAETAPGATVPIDLTSTPASPPKTDGLAAGATAPAVTPATQAALDTIGKAEESSAPETSQQTEPVVTTGVADAKTDEVTEAAEETPKAVEEPATTTQTEPVVNTGVADAKAPEVSEPVKPEPVTAEAAPKESPAPAPAAATEAQTQPTVTTGVAEAKAPEISKPVEEQKPAAPATTAAASSKPAPSSGRTSESGTSGAVTDAKKKRRSFFGKIKEKLFHKD